MTLKQTSWEQFRPRYEELERYSLTTENVESWLRKWRELDARFSPA